MPRHDGMILSPTLSIEGKNGKGSPLCLPVKGHELGAKDMESNYCNNWSDWL